jgi:NadR type nicotinamide-nucleotide adenylyltransferase
MSTLQKIAIVGPESTGKSTLARQLASHFNTLWVPEFARKYIDQLNRPYQQADLLTIAQGQLQSEKEAALLARQYLFCDTNLLVIKIWSEDKFGSCDPLILQHLSLNTYALHLLTFPDLPWQADPQREDPHRLGELFGWYQAELEEAGVPFAVVKGQREERLQSALAALQP